MSLDATMLGLGLAIVWIGLAGYMVRLHVLGSRLERDVQNLRSVLTMQRQRKMSEEE